MKYIIIFFAIIITFLILFFTFVKVRLVLFAGDFIMLLGVVSLISLLIVFYFWRKSKKR